MKRKGRTPLKCPWCGAPPFARTTIAEAREALELIVPLAKGYAAEHPVGSNQQYVEIAQAALAAMKDLHP